jgi:plasmid replication initiation protein
MRRKRGFEMSANIDQPVLFEQAASAVLAFSNVPATPPPELPVNTPATLGVTPRYVLQYNAISRAAKNLSATAHKLTAMAMSLLPPDLSSLTSVFTFGDFCKALGYGDGGEQYRIFTLAVEECMQCVITIETDPNKRGKKSWKKFTWFNVSRFNAETGIATMTFSAELAEFLLDLKRVYAKLNLRDIGKLQSKYALRYYELMMSYSFLKGKDGNSTDCWYFERSLQELRFILEIPENVYQMTSNFRRKVVEDPIKELNAAGIGFEIKSEKIKDGRNLSGIRFNCKSVPKTVTGRQKSKKPSAGEQLKLLDANPKTAEDREEKEGEHLKERYPDEFAAFYDEELAKPSSLPPTNFIRKIAAQSAAVIRLRERHGIAK